MNQGVPPHKIIAGIPFYAQTFTLSNKNSNFLNSPISAAGKAGEYTKEKGNLAYYEVNYFA